MFADAFQKYITAAQNARAENKLEQERKRLFLSFLQDAFHIDYADVGIEESIVLTSERRGFLDALFGDLLFEFKRSLDSGMEKTREQLLEYLKSSKRNYVGILSDGLKFQVYLLEDGKLRQTDAFELKADDPEGAFVRLDAYLFSQKAKPPTSADIVGRFGGNSPTFQAAFKALGELLEKAKAFPALAIWRDQWDKLLSKVYGSKLEEKEGDDLYLRHTYLCQFARLLAFAALRGLPENDTMVERILSGDAFTAFAVSNIGENDFYSWVLLPEIKPQAIQLFRRLALGLVVYDLKHIDQDLLKQLYQNLVDPSTRHDLGEYYTPDWLAELTLEDINYQHPQSLLDPACGSGSFLFATIKRLAAQGLTGWQLARFVADNVMGMDVHPLAVTVARINYLLALVEHLRSGSEGAFEIEIPIYLADALAQLGNGNGDKNTLPILVDEARDEKFFIPLSAAMASDQFSEVVNAMYEYASRSSGDLFKQEIYGQYFMNFVDKTLGQTAKVSAGVVSDLTPTLWRSNYRLLLKLIQEKRNGIWSYILKNQAQPLILAQRKFDVVVGNPPWLSYRFIKSRTYQSEVKNLYQRYRLLESDDVKLFTQMDLSTLFFVHARERYLKPEGTIAFVMPRAVITGAKQHRPFQALGFTRVIDLKEVTPLFNVETCVIVQAGNILLKGSLPSVRYSGKLPAHEMSLSEVQPILKKRQGTVQFVDSEVRSSYYYDRFQQGATLVPRTLCFVKPEPGAYATAMATDPDVDKDAKVPYKGIRLNGAVANAYLYATLLSKHLVPFGYERLHMVALPARVNDEGTITLLTTEADFFEKHHLESWDWFEKVKAEWDSKKKVSTAMSWLERLDYQKLLTKQKPRQENKVIYNKSGTHISAFVLDEAAQRPVMHQHPTQGFVWDYTTYAYSTPVVAEAHYLSAILNTPSVDIAIKAFQTRGLYKGERDITRTPFEACSIPPFDVNNADHMALARLSQAAHAKIQALKASGGLKGSVYTIRDQSRAAVKDELEAIDVVARRVLGL